MDSQPAGTHVLQCVLEGGDVGAVINQICDELVASFMGGLCTDIALDAARVIAETIGRWVWRNSSVEALDGTKVDFPAA